jgi:serine/threonine protein phosphatase PrpC/predicted Ser/Thr protein kinase
LTALFSFPPQDFLLRLGMAARSLGTMRELKDGVRSLVRIGYDGSVHKIFRGTDADKRFANEVRVLKYLEEKECPFVPQVLDAEAEELRLVTTNCGHPVERLSEEKSKSLFDELEKEFGVRHDDPFMRNITYSPILNRFCIIDFELAAIIGIGGEKDDEASAAEADENSLLTLGWFGISQKGQYKAENEDSLIAFSADVGGTLPLELEGGGDLHKSGYVLAVSDGLGGHPGGALASTLVVSKLAKMLSGKVGNLRGNAQPLAVLTSAVEEVHHSINRMAAGKPDIDGMAATIVCGWFWERHLHFVHVGDSRIYRWRNGELTQLTNDHTRVGRMFRDGKVNERQARSHPMNHVLQQVVGGQHQVINPQVGSLQTAPGDWFIFCSDGITDGLWNKHVTELFENAVAGDFTPEELAKAVLERAYSAAGRDDTTLFAARVGG